MPAFPHDIFTEPEDVDSDTLANLGPLRRPAGGWEGLGGVDVNPKADGPETRAFMERSLFEPIDPQANGPQLFYGMSYRIQINTPEEDITFHNQVGHWLWEPTTGLVIQTLSIPRGQIAIASGHAAPGATRLVVTAERGKTDYGICSTPFLEYAFRTDSYRLEVEFHEDGSWSYISDTMLIVRGRTEPFQHRDRNRLSKVSEPSPNPLMRILAQREAPVVQATLKD
jgi:hypothetical protein